jgi:hypothetical protein
MVCNTATAAEFRGDQLSMPIRLEQDLAVASQNGFDPRLVEPLPWNDESYLGTPRERIVSFMTQEVPIFLGVILFPILFLRRMIQRRQWTLRSLLLLPLLFVVPYLALRIPNEHGTLTANLYGVSGWLGTLLAAVMCAPIFVFLAVCLTRIRNSQWKRLIFLLAIMLAACLVPATLQILFGGAKLPEGGSYELWNPETLMLLSTGVWLVGFGLCCTWLFSRTFSVLQMPFKYFFRRSKAVVA